MTTKNSVSVEGPGESRDILFIDNNRKGVGGAKCSYQGGAGKLQTKKMGVVKKARHKVKLRRQREKGGALIVRVGWGEREVAAVATKIV